MAKTNLTWYLYYAGCVVLGLILGLGYLWLVPVNLTPVTELSQSSESGVVPSPVALPSTQPVTLLFTGDVMLGRSVNKNIVAHNDPTWPFKNVGELLSAADITYINLENPLVENCPVIESGFKFCGGLDNVKGLVYAGVDVASLANNHATNYGPAGLALTISVLESHGISPVGLGSPVKLTRRGQTFTFLSFNDIGPYPVPTQYRGCNGNSWVN